MKRRLAVILENIGREADNSKANTVCISQLFSENLSVKTPKNRLINNIILSRSDVVNTHTRSHGYM